jgi:antitoxin VapB
MSEEYRAKVFKSGNSLALRLPKALGLSEGTEMTVREDHGKFSFEPVDAPKRKIDVSKFVGKAPWLKPLTREDRTFEERELDWEGKLLKRNG